MILSKLFRLVLLFAPSSLSAQAGTAQDSTAFHSGQWAVQFGRGASLANLGVLRFTGPRRAWLLELDVLASQVNGERTNVGGTSPADERLTFLTARLGRRFYNVPRGKVVSFQTLVVEAGHSDQDTDLSLGASLKRTQWRAGLGGELGAGFMLTPNLSLGGTASASAGYLHRRTEDSGGTTKGNGWYVQGVEVTFVVGIYF